MEPAMSVALEMPDLPPDDLVQAALARRSLHEFVKHCYRKVQRNVNADPTLLQKISG